MRYTIILLLALACSVSFGGTRNPKKSDDQYVQYGLKFTYVQRIKCVTNDGIDYYASATALDNHWLLTAAHVVSRAKSAEIISGNKIIKITKILPHKDFIEAKYGYNDIALCYVEESLNLDFYPELYTGRDEVGKVCSISGYGAYGTFDTGISGTDGRRRAGSNIIENVDRHLLVCKASRPESRDNTELEFIIANGDSGGGLFIGNKLAGVNSCVMALDRKPDSNYGDEAGHTRVSQFVDWIVSNKK